MADAKQLPPPGAAVNPPAAAETQTFTVALPDGRDPTGLVYTKNIRPDGKWDDSMPTDVKLATEKPGPPIEAPEPETYEKKHGPFKTQNEALQKIEELSKHRGFPMLKQSWVTEGKIGKDFPVFYLNTVMRNRFPPAGKWVPNYVDEKDLPQEGRARCCRCRCPAETERGRVPANAGYRRVFGREGAREAEGARAPPRDRRGAEKTREAAALHGSARETGSPRTRSKRRSRR